MDGKMQSLTDAHVRSRFSFLVIRNIPSAAVDSGLHQLTDISCRLFSVQIQQRLLDPALLPPALQAIRGAVFPDNVLAPPRVPPTSDEVTEIKRECAKAIVELVPKPVRVLYFATEDTDLMRKDVEQTLDLFGNAYVNRHFVVALMDLLLVRLFPETIEQSFVE